MWSHRRSALILMFVPPGKRTLQVAGCVPRPVLFLDELASQICSGCQSLVWYWYILSFIYLFERKGRAERQIPIHCSTFQIPAMARAGRGQIQGLVIQSRSLGRGLKT